MRSMKLNRSKQLNVHNKDMISKLKIQEVRFRQATDKQGNKTDYQHSRLKSS